MFNLFKRQKQPDWPKAEEKVIESNEGIFHVKRTDTTNGMGDSWKTVERTVEGRVIGFREGRFVFPSQSFDRPSPEFMGTHITLESEKGTASVDFPAEAQRESLRGQQVRYYHSRQDYSERSGLGFVTDKYKIDVLTGPARGESFAREVTA